jgi:predicted esterase
MKKSLLLVSFFSLFAFAQAQRYLNPVFDSVTVLPDIVYGSSITVNGDTAQLLLDIYQPFNDTPGVKRPLLVLAHGGSFISGSRKSADMVNICTRMAKRGYVVASIQYRLGINLFSGNTLEKEFSHAVWRATQDGRAAVRWFRQDAANGNTYQINDEQIFSGGVSAGGVLGMHLAFLDQASELAQTSIDTNLLGGIEGNSGNPGYSWRIKGVINLCGAISNVSWMLNNPDVKICSMHGTNDQTVPYKTNYFFFLSAQVAILQGSFSIDSFARQNGMYSDFYTFQGAPHVPFVNNAAYMDTTIEFVSQSLYNQLFGKTTTIANMQNALSNVAVYPNPANTQIQITGLNSNNVQAVVSDISGKIHFAQPLDLSQTIDISKFPQGIYFVNLQSEQSNKTLKFVKCQ